MVRESDYAGALSVLSLGAQVCLQYAAYSGNLPESVKGFLGGANS
jgi:hypothetical protein